MPKNQKPNFILIGKSGSGKGTQAKLLKKHFGNLLHVVSGDLFRDLAKKNTRTGKRVSEVVNKGRLPFENIATTLWMNFIALNLKEKQGLICDGFPRRVEEAKDLDSFLDFLGIKQETYIFLIDISYDLAFTRLLKRKTYKKGRVSKRADDNLKAIKNRMAFFKESVVPTLNYYKKQGRLINIDGEQVVGDVFKDILKAVKK